MDWVSIKFYVQKPAWGPGLSVQLYLMHGTPSLNLWGILPASIFTHSFVWMFSQVQFRIADVLMSCSWSSKNSINKLRWSQKYTYIPKMKQDVGVEGIWSDAEAIVAVLGEKLRSRQLGNWAFYFLIHTLWYWSRKSTADMYPENRKTLRNTKLYNKTVLSFSKSTFNTKIT